VVTNLPKDGWGDPVQAARFEAGILYEKFYCAENRIKEQQLDLFAERTSTVDGFHQIHNGLLIKAPGEISAGCRIRNALRA
jgi:hypothetical protein